MNITAGIEMIKADTYGFIYITTNNVNQKRYVGQKKIDKRGSWKNYIGSGVILSRAIDKYGADAFTKEIVDVTSTIEELNDKEIQWISKLDAVGSDEF